ncbi:MAG: hypothetical protein M1378_00560 [Bacteroidetes bacterium]|nr:hypothetical protein [Bacteroidota bacterium]
MSDTVLAALIGVGGAVIVAVASVIFQFFTTKKVISAQHVLQLKEKRLDSIRLSVSELLVTSDPQSNHGVDYGKSVNLISQVQLLLDYSNERECSLNSSLNLLGHSMQEYVPVQLLDEDRKATQLKQLLQAHANVLESAKAVISVSGEL